jgi:hypothetical protein
MLAPGRDEQRAGALVAVFEEQCGVREGAGKLFVLFEKGLAIGLTLDRFAAGCSAIALAASCNRKGPEKLSRSG